MPGVLFKIPVAAVHDRFACLAKAVPTLSRHRAAFKVLVDGEKMFDLAADLRENIVDRVDLIVTRVSGSALPESSDWIAAGRSCSEVQRAAPRSCSG